MQYLCDSITTSPVTVNNGELWRNSLVKHCTQLIMHRALVTNVQQQVKLTLNCLVTVCYMVKMKQKCTWLKFLIYFVI